MKTKSLVTHFKEGRLKSGMSQSEVAKELGYTSAQFISNFERGISKLPLKALAKLIDLYELKTDVVMSLLVSEYKTVLANTFKAKTRKGS
jgi:transcriptional regulator with XRE-family HTH domain